MILTQLPISYEILNSHSTPQRKRFIEQLFTEAFPPDERRSFESLWQKADEENPMQLRLLCVEGEPVGAISLWEWEDWLYVEYLATDKNRRGGGLGQRALEALIAECKKPIVLEVEKPEDEMSRRRIGFYNRTGFVLWDKFEYTQPAYDATKNPIPLYLMVQGEIPYTAQQFEEFETRIHREVYGVK